MGRQQEPAIRARSETGWSDAPEVGASASVHTTDPMRNPPMASSKVAPRSHIELNASASLFRNSPEASDAGGSVPRMLQAYRPQQDMEFAKLPFEVETLILSALSDTAQPGSPLLCLGLTCNYFHLRVRDHIENASEGRRFRRTFEHHQYAASYGVTPVEHAKEKIGWRAAEQLERWANNWHAPGGTDIHGSNMRLRDPVTIAIGNDLTWSSEFAQVLAKRMGYLTVLDFLSKPGDAEFLIKSIRTTPRASYLALAMTPANFSLPDAQSIAKEMALHPVVCFVQIADEIPDISGKHAGFGLNLLAACAEHAVDSCQFSLKYDVMHKDKAAQLADVIRKFKCGVTIEISANRVTPDCMTLLFDAVRFCNQSSATLLKLCCQGIEIAKAVGLMDGMALAQAGIHVQYLNQALKDSHAGAPDDDSASDQEVGLRLSQLDLSYDGSDLEFASDADEQ